MLKVTEIVRMVEGQLNQFLTIEDLAKALVRPYNKTEMWSAAEFEGGRRADKNWLCTPSVFVIDIDDGLSAKDAEARLKNTGLGGIILATKSHQQLKGDKPACDRYRIVLELLSPITTRESYDATWQHVQSIFPEMDPSCKDESRGYYYSTKLLSVVRGQPIQPKAGGPPKQINTPPTQVKGKLSRATRDFLAQEPASFPWHTRFFKAAVDMKEQGYTQEEAAQRLASASPQHELDATDRAQLRDVYENRGGALEFRIDWPIMLPATKNSPPRVSPTAIKNLRFMLTELLQVQLRFNVRREIVYIQMGGNPLRRLANGDVATLATKAREYGLQAGPALDDLIKAMALEAPFDPLLGAMESLPVTKPGQIDALFETLTLPTDTTETAKQWYKLMLRRWLIGAVRKAYEPGSENNVLVFQGQQAAGKSRWLKRLGSIWPEGFGEGGIHPEDKDHELRHLDNFLWHVAEFDSTTSRREVGALKDYFTKDTVTVRRPYSPLPIIGQSICSFCASVNSFDFLHDATGNRRYLIIPVVAVNADHKVDIEAVWSEARAAYQAGERQWFSREEIVEVNTLNTRFMSREEYLDDIEEKAAPGEDALSIRDIMVLMHWGNVQLTKPVRSNVRATLEKLGIKTKTRGNSVRFLVDKSKLEPQNSNGWKQ